MEGRKGEKHRPVGCLHMEEDHISQLFGKGETKY